MTYVITDLCIRDGSCVLVCPVECIVPGPNDQEEWPGFYIDPDTCIDCGACPPECPVDAIFPDYEVPAEYAADEAKNAAFFAEGPGYWDYDLEEQRVEPD
ncbi:MAG: ferredoxin family protein [Anaerolineae bacterium]|jgi:ferredoxin--NADP+ reductase